jgi:hypothetical protein
MPESYTGDEGDTALAAGMPVMDGTEKRQKGYLAINKTRDLIVSYVTSAIAAAIATIWPISAGGTGASTAASARSNLGAPESAVGQLKFTSPGFGRLVWQAPGVSAGTEFAPSDVANGRVQKTGDEMSGFLRVLDHVYVPNSFAAVSGYTIAYINGPDGRLSKGASSERYKDNIDRAPDVPDVFAVPLASFTMVGDEAEVTRYGYIAEDLAANPETAGFVVYDDQGRPDSFDMISFLLAQNAVLNARLTVLEADHAGD